MKTVLLISSQLASSNVGASASAFAMQRMGLKVITLPTVLMGRHPGWGDPGLVEIDAGGLSRMFQAVQAQGILSHVDAVVTGYFRDSRQITIAAEMIDDVRMANKDVKIVVDPVMGDDREGLYVAEAVAQAILTDLVPRADVLSPNAWELARLADRPVVDENSAVAAARRLACPLVLVSSVPDAEQITTLAVEAENVWSASTAHYKNVPHGTGDLLCALFCAHLLLGETARKALEKSVSSLAMVVSEAVRQNTQELPLVQTQAKLVSPHLEGQ